MNKDVMMLDNQQPQISLAIMKKSPKTLIDPILSLAWYSLRLSIRSVFFILPAIMPSQGLHAADLYRKTVEVFGTGTAQLKAWTGICSGAYVTKPDSTRGLVLSVSSQSCDGYNRWQIRWPGDATDRWSAENWLRVVPPNLTVYSSVSRSPGYVTAGNALRVSCDIANLGEGNARSSTTKILILRADTFAIIAEEDFIETAEILPGYYIPFSYDVTIPANTPAGNYIARVEVDSQGDIGQIDYGDDLKDSSSFTVVPVYTVAVSAGAGGAIDPSGVQTVASGSSITFTATPNANFGVKEWSVDGNVVQAGGPTYKLNNITSDKTVNVSFVRLYNLTVNVEGQGTWILSPPGGSYPAGTLITATATPESGNHFSEWSGAQYSRDRVFSFAKGGASETLNLLFIPNISPSPLDFTVAQSTPSTIGITIPTPTSWITICEVCNDLNAPVWRIVGLSEGQTSTGTITRQIPDTGEFARYTSMPKVATPAFLTFPIRIGGVNAFNAPVTAILDHHRGDASIHLPYDKDHSIGTCFGKAYPVLKANQGLGKDFAILPAGESAPDIFNYIGVTDPGQVGSGYLQYDGHVGYDYGYGADIDVYASAPGRIVTDADFTGSNLANTGLVAKYMKDYHGLIIRHHPQGYCTIYMHLSWIDPRYVDTSDPLNWKPKQADVDITQPIGKTGSFGAKNPHLHFEVWRSDDTVWKYADPYGVKAFVDGAWKTIYPSLW